MEYYEDIIKQKKNEKTLKSFVHNHCTIDIEESMSWGEKSYHVSVVDKNYKTIGTKYLRTLDEAIRWGKEVAEKESRNSKDKENYYEKIIQEKKNRLEPVNRAQQLAHQGVSYSEMIDIIREEYHLTLDQAQRAVDQGKRHYELTSFGIKKNPIKL